MYGFVQSLQFDILKLTYLYNNHAERGDGLTRGITAAGKQPTHHGQDQLAAKEDGCKDERIEGLGEDQKEGMGRKRFKKGRGGQKKIEGLNGGKAVELVEKE